MAFHQPKLKISEQEKKEPYIIYNYHSKPDSERIWNEPYYQLLSIDPAEKNLALRVERRYFDGKIIPLAFDKVDVRNTSEGVTIDVYGRAINFLDRYKQLYYGCHYVIIERQLPFNYRAVRISQHIITYLMLLLKDTSLLPIIVELSSKVKGKYLDAPDDLNDKGLKRWATEKARELLQIRGDQWSIDVMNFFWKKQDDLADTICQIEAFFILLGLKPITVINFGLSEKVEKNEIILIPKISVNKPKLNVTRQIAGSVFTGEKPKLKIIPLNQNNILQNNH